MYKMLNENHTRHSNSVCIHQLFEYQVNETPDCVAVSFEDNSLTYCQLNQKANKLANWLIRLGLGPGDNIGVCIDRSIEMVIGIVAVLKAGCAYVPIDPSYPATRINHILSDAELSIVLTDFICQEKIDNKYQMILLDKIFNELELLNIGEKDPEVVDLNPSDLAYIIYTSGSTGRPKGVMIEHNALVNRIEWMRDQYGCDQSDAVLQKTSFSFDVSVWEFFLPLISGARIVLAKPDGHKDPVYLVNVIKKNRVTKVHFVPSMLNAMLTAVNLSECSSLKQIFCSGEALKPSFVDKFFTQGNLAELHNLYGPTEATIDVSYWKCSVADAAKNSVPIGHAIHNTQLYILDEHLNLAPLMQPGELYIGGAGLARGYINLPELTSEKFIDNPISPAMSKKLYKTGDLCQYLIDGGIEFIGRIDEQVKIKGYRIELGEVEAALSSHPNVDDAAVVVKELRLDHSVLIAYVICKEIMKQSELNDYLKSILPSYMLPVEINFLTSFPVTASGKLDKNSLKKISYSGQDGAMSDISFLQQNVLEIWKTILEFDGIGIDDDLFSVGGDSISAIQIISAVNKEFGCDIYLEQIFSSQLFSVRWLSELIEAYQISLLGEEEYYSLINQINEMSESEIAELLRN